MSYLPGKRVRIKAASGWYLKSIVTSDWGDISKLRNGSVNHCTNSGAAIIVTLKNRKTKVVEELNLCSEP